MDCISICFTQLISDGLQYTNNIADGPILILDSHIYNAPGIFNAVKCCIHFYATFPEFLPDIPWKSNISPSGVRIFVYYSVIFELLHNNLRAHNSIIL